MGLISEFAKSLATPSGAAGVLSLGGNIVSQIMANRANERLAGLANQWSLEQWNRENAYNTPEAQRKRLEEAGFNPNLVYAQGNLMNEAAQSPAVTSAAGTQRPAFNVDPLTAAQIANINSQTDKADAEREAIEHQTKREDEKQPQVLQQLVEGVNKLRHEVKNLSFDEQLKSVDYLRSSLAYSRDNATFNDAVATVHEALQSTRLRNKYSLVEIERALSLLPYEIAGFDLSNKKLQADIALSWQQYQQSRELFDGVLQLQAANINDANASFTLKQLDLLIKAADNPDAAFNMPGVEDTRNGFVRWRDGFFRRLNRFSNSLNLFRMK